MESPFLKLHDIRKSYRLGETEVEALRGVSLDVRKGEFMAVVGASGSGKSTLLNIIGGLDSPDSGEIHLNGKDVTRLSEVDASRMRNRSIGFIFQSFNLIPVLNVTENVELPLLLRPELNSVERRDMVRVVLEDVGLADFSAYRPDKLSGGQRQRVAIARALVAEPVLVLADEPTANLDSRTAHLIIDLMLDLNQRRHVTFLFSTHDEKLMGRVSRIMHISDGVIEESAAELHR